MAYYYTTGNFWFGVIVGWVVMVLLNIWVPVLGPILGGLAAGLIAGRGAGNGALAGLIAGVLGAIIVAIFLVLGITLLTAGIDFLNIGGIQTITGLAAAVVLSILVLGYMAILGLIGGAIGGAIRP
ncbi:MAG: DUF5518 domain-containing protein [Methanomicrobiales archaeon]|nr:DUF5518 domain-containing protein [Methanomicrobiales archaeon]MDI6875462.1 DUF5518 domain-containing protein [Methanomicrobiales archaeon]